MSVEFCNDRDARPSTRLTRTQVLRAERDDARELAKSRLAVIDDLAERAAHYEEALRSIARNVDYPRNHEVAVDALDMVPGGAR